MGMGPGSVRAYRRVFLSALVLCLGCGGPSRPQPALMKVLPARAYNNADVPVVIQGGPFRPALRIDTASGTTTADTAQFSVFLRPSAPYPGATGDTPAVGPVWRSSRELGAAIPAGLPAGFYDVEVRDPRGESAVLPAGYESAGRDETPPLVQITEPLQERFFERDTLIRGRAMATDDGGLASIVWQARHASGAVLAGNECLPFQPMSMATCDFEFRGKPETDVPMETVTLLVWARDEGGNESVPKARELYLVRKPVFRGVNPFLGPARGGTVIVVDGSDFVAGTSRIFIDGVVVAPPEGESTDTESMLSGVTPEHPDGDALVTVRTGGVESGQRGTFTFVAPPNLRAIDPSFGLEAADTEVILAGNHFRSGTTMISIGADGVRRTIRSSVINSSRMRATIPPGTGVISIFADDPAFGGSVLPDAFTYKAAMPPPMGN